MPIIRITFAADDLELARGICDQLTDAFPFADMNPCLTDFPGLRFRVELVADGQAVAPDELEDADLAVILQVLMDAGFVETACPKADGVAVALEVSQALCRLNFAFSDSVRDLLAG